MKKGNKTILLIFLSAYFFAMVFIFLLNTVANSPYPKEPIQHKISLINNTLRYNDIFFTADSVSSPVNQPLLDTLFFSHIDMPIFDDIQKFGKELENFLQPDLSYFSTYLPNHEELKKGLLQLYIIKHCSMDKNVFSFSQSAFLQDVQFIDERISDLTTKFEPIRWFWLYLTLFLTACAVLGIYFFPKSSLGPSNVSSQEENAALQDKIDNQEAKVFSDVSIKKENTVLHKELNTLNQQLEKQAIQLGEKSQLLQKIWRDLNIQDRDESYSVWSKAFNSAKTVLVTEKIKEVEVPIKIGSLQLPTEEQSEEHHLYVALAILEQILGHFQQEDQKRVKSILEQAERDFASVLQLKAFAKKSFKHAGLDEITYQDPQEQDKVYAKISIDHFFSEYAQLIEQIKNIAAVQSHQEAYQNMEAKLFALKEKHHNNSIFSTIIDFLKEILLRNLNDMFIRHLLIPKVEEFSNLADVSNWPNPLTKEHRAALMKFFLPIGVLVYDYCNYRILYDKNPSQLSENDYSPTKNMVIQRSTAAALAKPGQYFGRSAAQEDDFVRAVYNLAKENGVEVIDGFVKGYYISPSSLK